MAFTIGPVTHAETYRLRSVPGGYPGDIVKCHDRVINGKRFSFSRITWGDGSVTVRAYEAGNALPYIELTGCGGMYVDPEQRS